MIKRAFKWTSCLLALLTLLSVVLCGLASWIIFTNQGLNTLLWGVEKALPALKTSNAEGSLLSRFTLNNVSYKEDGFLDLDIKQATLALNPQCLLKLTVCIDELDVSDTTFSMTSTSAPKARKTTDYQPVRSVSSPFPIVIRQASLNNIELFIDDYALAWETFNTQLSFKKNKLQIDETNWSDIRLVLPDVNTASTSETVSKPNQTLAAQEKDRLPDVWIPLQIEVNRLNISRFELVQDTPIIVNNLALSASAFEHQVTLNNLALDMPEGNATLKGEITLQNQYPLSLLLNAEIKHEEAKGQKLQLAVSGSVDDLRLEAEFTELVKAALKGQVQPLKPDIPFELSLKKGKIQWPLVSQHPDYSASDLSLTAKGSLASYILTLKGAIKGKDIPDIALKMNGKGSVNHIDLSSLTLNTLGGKIQASAQADWKKLAKWQASMTLTEIQPDLYWPDLKGVVNGQLETTGALTSKGGWNVSLPMLDVKGLIRGQRLAITGKIEASDDAGKGDIYLSTPNLTFAHGANKIVAKGTLDKTWQMALSVDIPELATTIPDLKGKVQGTASLRGELMTPTIDLDLNANSIVWQKEMKLTSAILKGDLKPLPDLSGNMKLQARNFEYQDEVIDNIDLVFSGISTQHQLTLDVASKLISANLLVTGVLSSKSSQWNGKLEHASLSTKQGEWALNQATAIDINLDKQQAVMASHCWLQKGASFCLNDTAKLGEAGAINLSLNAFELSQIALFLPRDLRVEGKVDAEVRAAWFTNKSPQVSIQVNGSKGSVTQRLSNPVTLVWDSIMFEAAITNNRLISKWLFNIANNGNLAGELTIPNVAIEQKKMDATLTLSKFNLDFLSPIIGEHNQLKSDISTNLRLEGLLLHPKITGRLDIDHMQVKGDISPVDVDSGQLAINFMGYQAKLESKLQTPEGELRLNGHADWQNLKDWKATLQTVADGLLVDLAAFGKIKVVPDMTLMMSPKRAKIDGSIHLPWGRITVDDLPPSAVTVSSDQVILTPAMEPIEEKNTLPFNVQTNLMISVGDDVTLSAFGLKGNLEGQLKVTQKKKRPLINGEIQIKNGEYSSFGQELLIREGKIVMHGPMGVPFLSFDAIRNPDNTADDVIVGVKVTGSANNPLTTIFSEPGMAQSNALSYLLRGKNIDGESSGNEMTMALISLSLAQSGKVVGELGEAFGIQDLQLDTEGSGDDSQVTISGYIMPGLQVRYGVGIFNSIGELTVRYRLMTDLYVEVVSGLNSAVDLLYQFELK